jgi:Asp-tRNA(Asn)/Glu-tRNA(Gln) amidotransferase A subunit family amidase
MNMSVKENEMPGLIRPHSLASTAEALRIGRMDLMEYVDLMCTRVEAADSRLEAMLVEPERRDRLCSEAAALLKKYPDPDTRPPLYGLLVGIKDIFHVSGFVTRAGTKVPPDLFAGSEAQIVRLLRDAGSLILGKSVTTEFAYFEPGPTRNPHNPDHTPGGSSSGSAAAVAAGYCALALGTQTIGSVTRPAAFCGIVGFKPTLDRLPSEGLVYFSRTIDHVGLFTQDIAGMALAASVLCRDWQTQFVRGVMPTLGIPIGPYLEQTEPSALAAFEYQIQRLAEIGCVVKRIPLLDDIADLNRLHRQMVFAEFAREHADIYAEHANLYRPRTAEIIEIGQRVDEEELVAARTNGPRLRDEIEAIMSDEGIDLWVCPAACGDAPAGIHATGDPSMSLPWTHTGMPVINLPGGYSENRLPLSLQFIAPYGNDEALLSWAQALEIPLGSLQ